MNNDNPNITFHPLISAIQKVVLYETKTRLYLVGSNNRETRFRLLIIDRTKHNQLVIEENPNEFGALEIRRFLGSIGGSPRVISAYGVLGFIRFLEGYYLLLVTKRKCCAHIGMHLIYTIKDTVMVRVNEPTALKQPHPFEERYRKMFQNIDIRSNFYFSYSYDVTRTLQYNEAAPRYVGPQVDIEVDEPLPDWGNLTNNVQAKNERVDYAFRSNARKRFIWNAHLLEPMRGIMLRDWLLEVTHGYISQSCISIFGRHVNVCLIARRSTRYAGTRFLKRGANCNGDVANEVETEQIVTDGQRMCSFTQMRGSVPSHWSQDISKMVPKPPIQLDICDPYAQTPARHFERLLFHYGSPLIMLNLVKKREKRKHESIISKELVNSISYLNQFLPPQHRMKYIHFDMARKSRCSDANVMEMLANIAEGVLQQTNMFFKASDSDCTYQTGIVRTNCVDCLDRTNTAQFAIGKCALGHQLQRLGFVNSPLLEFDSDCVTMLENLYEEHGDTLALQYGGSQLVHRIKTYRKTAAWASQGNDIMQTLSRYYSNTFSDTEKQQSINLFLGFFVPGRSHSKQSLPIWEIESDYNMHNETKAHPSPFDARFITDWVRPKVRMCLPYSCSDSHKIVKELFRLHSKDLEMIDAYSNYHQSFKWTDLNEHISFEISQLAMRYMPSARTNYSPFQRQIQDRNKRKNPSLIGHSSTGSGHSNSSSSSEADDSSSDEDLSTSYAEISKETASIEPDSFTLESLLPPMEQIYGCKITNPTKPNMTTYKKYVKLGKLSSGSPFLSVSQRDGEVNKLQRAINLEPLGDYGSDCYTNVKPPKVDAISANIYRNYCSTAATINDGLYKEFDIFCQYLETK